MENKKGRWDEIPTLSAAGRILFPLVNMVFIIPPLLLLFYTLFNIPEYFSDLVKIGPLQPLGWLFLIIIAADYIVLMLLVFRAIKLFEKQPLIKSIVNMLVIVFLEFFTFFVVATLPGLFLFLQLLTHFP